MARSPSAPITVYDNGDLKVYPDVASACADLEVYDIDDLTIFDGQGYRLRVETHGQSVTGMSIAADIAPAASDLEAKLKAFISQVGPDRVGLPDVEAASLSSALEALLRFFQS